MWTSEEVLSPSATMTTLTRTTGPHARVRRLRAFVSPSAAAAAWLLSAVTQAGAAPGSLMYRCTLANGRAVVSMQNLAENYPGGFSSCSLTAEAGFAPRVVHLDGKLPRVLWAAPTALAQGPQGSEPMAAMAAQMPASLLGMEPVRSWAGRSTYDELIATTSAKHGIDPDLARAVMHVESAGKPRAVSNKGAIGLMQIMPGTGARYGVDNPADLYRPEINVDAGIRYLRDLMRMFKGRIDLVLAAYNAGEGAVMKYGWQIPPYAETRAYVKRVGGLYDGFVAARARGAAR
jgi:soluble lytic murein transglycosylase-like protein